MTTAALVLFGAYFGIAFVLRSFLQWRRTGDTGFRGLSGTPLTADWWAGVLFVGALLVGASGPVSALAGVDPLPLLEHPPIQVAGIVLASVGILATFATQVQMGASWRVGVDEDERTDLVTSGIFGVVRNPIFSAMLGTGLGLVLIVPNWPALVGLALLVIAIEIQVRSVEEPYLRTVHGTAYASYLRTTGRFVPGLGRERTSAPAAGH